MKPLHVLERILDTLDPNGKNSARERVAFVQGFVAAKAPTTPIDILATCADADAAYAEWCKQRESEHQQSRESDS